MSHVYLKKSTKVQRRSSKETEAEATSSSTKIDRILHLQQTLGNQATMQLLRQENAIQRIEGEDGNDDLLLDPAEIEAIENGSEGNESDEELLLDPSEFENIEDVDDENEAQHPMQARFDRNKAIVDYQLNRLDEADVLYNELQGFIDAGDFEAAAGIFDNLAQDNMFVNPHFSAYAGRSFHHDDFDTYVEKMHVIQERSPFIRNAMAKIAKNFFEHPKMYLVVSDYVAKRNQYKAKEKKFQKGKKEQAKEQRKKDRKDMKELIKYERKRKKQDKKYNKKKYKNLRDRQY